MNPFLPSNSQPSSCYQMPLCEGWEEEEEIEEETEGREVTDEEIVSWEDPNGRRVSMTGAQYKDIYKTRFISWL